MVTKVVKFSANWCAPCKALAPKMVEISKKFANIKFEEIDIDKDPDSAEKYSIRSLPTVLLFDENDKVIERIHGYAPEKIETTIQINL